MRLDEYLSKNDIKQADFARLVGESPQNIQRYANGTRRPSEDATYQRIAEVTNGAVTANDFYGITAKPKPKKADRHV